MKCNEIINVDTKPKINKLFFGEYGGYAREDEIKYPQLVKLSEASESNTWFKNEISYSEDIPGWAVMMPQSKSMFKKNISYQNLMDSGVVDIFSMLSQFTTNPELQYLYQRIAVEESIHARTYSNGLNVVFGSEATDILDAVYVDDNIKSRIINEVDAALEFKRLCITEQRDDDEAKMSLLKLIGAVYLLESIKFPFSFFVTWQINKVENNAIQGFSRALKLISWDEFEVHYNLGSYLLKLFRRDSNEGLSHLYPEFEKFMKDFCNTIVERELEWNDYLLEDGEIQGYNKEIGKHFIQYHAMIAMDRIKIDSGIKEKSSDIITAYDNYKDLQKSKVAQQEAEATNYQKGKLINDLYKFSLAPDVLNNVLNLENNISELEDELERLSEEFINIDEMPNITEENRIIKKEKIYNRITTTGENIQSLETEKRELI